MTAVPEKDPRAWIRVSNTLPDHPKVLTLSDGAFRSLIEMWCYCSRQRTDGKLTKPYWMKHVKLAARKQLLAAGLAEELTDGTIYMHDYEKHQLTAVEMMAARELDALSRQQGGKMTAHQRWHSGRGVVDPDCQYCARSSAGSSATPKPVASNVASNVAELHSQLVAAGRSEEIREEEKIKTIAPAAPTRKPDPIWNTLIEVLGYKPEEITGSQRGALNKAVAELRAVDATPNQIKLRARRYTQTYAGINLTAPALVKHWAMLGNNQPKAATTKPSEFGGW